MSLFERSSDLASTLSNSQRSKGCVPYDPNATAPTYGYDPSLVAGIIFTVVFFLSMLVSIWQVGRSRKWWYSSLVLGALGEGLGWAGRAAAHHCSYDKTFFSLQISILIICECPIQKHICLLVADKISSMLLQRRMLLHPGPDDSTIWPSVQPHLCNSIPLHFHHLRRSVHYYSGHRWRLGVQGWRPRPSRKHEARNTHNDGWYYHPTCLNVGIRNALAGLPVPSSRCGILEDAGRCNNIRGILYRGT